MQQKNYNIEVIRVMAFVMVVIIHVSNYFCRAYEKIALGEYLFSLILNVLSRVSVPCFFMISGALLLGRNESMAKSLKRIYRFLSVLIIWSGIYYIFNMHYMGQDVELKEILKFQVEAHLWYLYVMIPVYLILPFLQAMLRGMDEKLDRSFVIMGIVLVVLNRILIYTDQELYYDVPLFGDRVYIYYLFLGHFIVKYKERIPKKKELWISIYLLSSMVTVIAVIIGSFVSKDHMEVFLNYGCTLIVVSSVAFFIMILQAWDGQVQMNIRMKKTVDLLCGCSFGIYLIHIIFLDIFKKHVKAYEVSAYWAIPILVISILGVSFLCVYLMRKTFIGRRIT